MKKIALIIAYCGLLIQPLNSAISAKNAALGVGIAVAGKVAYSRIQSYLYGEQRAIQELLENIKNPTDSYFFSIDRHLFLGGVIHLRWLLGHNPSFNRNQLIVNALHEFEKNQKSVTKTYKDSENGNILTIEFFDDKELQLKLTVSDVDGTIMAQSHCNGWHWKHTAIPLSDADKVRLESMIKGDIYRMLILEMAIRPQWSNNALLEQDLQKLYNSLERNSQDQLDKFCKRWKLNLIKIVDSINEK